MNRVMTSVGWMIVFAAATPCWSQTHNDAVAPAQIRQWIQDLDASQFSKRQEATTRLQRRGKAVFDQLVEAAKSDSRERWGRAIQILEFHFRNGDDVTKAAAKEALQKIASRGDGAAANRAKHILNPPPAAPMRPAVPQGGVLQIRGVGQIIQGGRRISVDKANGVTTVKMAEKGREVKLVEAAQPPSITLTIRETKQGKPQVTVVQAKTADELKKKDAKAFQLYQELHKHAGMVGNVQILQLGAGAIPPIQLRAPARRPAKPELQKAIADLEQAIESLEKSGDQAKARQSALEQVKAAKERLENLLK